MENKNKNHFSKIFLCIIPLYMIFLSYQSVTRLSKYDENKRTEIIVKLNQIKR